MLKLNIVSILLILERSDGLKLSPIAQHVHRVDISAEAQLLASVFKDAYQFVHNERMKAISDQTKSASTTFDSIMHSRYVRKLKSSIDRWTVLEEKLHQSVPASSSAAFKQVFIYT